MSDTPRKTAVRLQHVVAHRAGGVDTDPLFDDVTVFGTELEALRFMLGKANLVYAAVAHGQSFAGALKAGRA